jgi:hypothetical protein
MRPAGVLGAYAAGLALVFTGALGVGSLLGPIDRPAAAAMQHDEAHLPVAGLAVAQDGYVLQLADPVLAPGTPLRFTVSGPDGQPLEGYETRHEKELHLVVVRRDLADYHHVHPQRAADGTWSVPLDLRQPGPYKVIADLVPAGQDDPIALAADLTVAGSYAPAAVPASSSADGYDVTLDGHLVPGRESALRFTITRDGKPVTDLQPYLGASGHLVALREGDLAYLHVHPDGSGLQFAADVPSPGRYRLFLEFRHENAVHTVSFAAVAR